MNARDLTSYLAGHSDGDQERHLLTREGARIIVTVLRMTLPTIRSTGEQFATVLKMTDGLVTTLGEEAAAKRHFDLESIAGLPIQSLFQRVDNLVSDIALSAPDRGKSAGDQIALALSDSDPNMRALATVHSVTRGIPANTVSGALIHLHMTESDPLIKFGAATALLGLSDEPHRIIVSTATINMLDFLHSMVFKCLPALVHNIRERNRRESESTQIRLIARVAMYYTLVLSR